MATRQVENSEIYLQNRHYGPAWIPASDIFFSLHKQHAPVILRTNMNRQVALRLNCGHFFGHLALMYNVLYLQSL